MNKVDNLEQAWCEINLIGISKIYDLLDQGNNRISIKDYSRVYTLIYDICYQNCEEAGKFFYTHLENVCNDFLSRKTIEFEAAKSEQKIISLQGCWNKYTLLSKWLINFFKYLYRFYLKN